MSKVIISTGSRRLVRVACGIAQIFFNAQQLVVFGQTIRAGKRAGLDLQGIGSYGDISNGGIFSFAGRCEITEV